MYLSLCIRGRVLTGNFCAECGEAVVPNGDLSLRHLMHDFVHDSMEESGEGSVRWFRNPAV